MGSKITNDQHLYIWWIKQNFTDRNVSKTTIRLVINIFTHLDQYIIYITISKRIYRNIAEKARMFCKPIYIIQMSNNDN